MVVTPLDLATLGGDDLDGWAVVDHGGEHARWSESRYAPCSGWCCFAAPSSFGGLLCDHLALPRRELLVAQFLHFLGRFAGDEPCWPLHASVRMNGALPLGQFALHGLEALVIDHQHQ